MYSSIIYRGLDLNIDNKDKKILTLLAKNPHMSQGEIANEIGLSQSSVASRIEKLKQRDMIETQIGINPLKNGLSIAKVDITTNDPSLILDKFLHCPYFINGYTVSGKYNLCLFFISEKIEAIEALVNHHIRSIESVTDITFNIVTGAKKKFIVPIKFVSENCSIPPCANQDICKDCNDHIVGKCLGCPATDMNKRWLS